MMRNTDEETGYWNYWARMPSLAILFMCLVGSLSAFGQWNTSLGIFTNQSNFTFSNNGTDLGLNTQMVYLPDGANHSSLRFAYVNGSNFNQLLHCSKSAVTGSGWVAVQIPQIQTGTNTTTIVAVWNTSESFIANVSTCGAGSPFTTSIPTPAAANFDSSILEQDNPTYLRLYMVAGGGSARSYPSAANMLSIISFEMLNVNATVGRPCVGWGNPSAGVFACMVFGQINASFYGDWTGYANGNISSPVVGMPVTLLLDMNTTQAMGRLLYPNGTVTPWLSVGGAVPTSNGSVASFGMDFDQQVKVHFVGAAYGYGLRNITYANTTGTAISMITTTIYGPDDLTSYNSATANITLAINCSGNDASGYLVNITKNGDANITGVSAPNNVTLNYSLSSLSIGTYVWSVLCYNATTSTNSTARTFYLVNTLPNISALNITQNGSAFTYGPLQANITAQDAESTSLTIFYTWFVNGLNASSGSFTAGNNSMTTINAGLTPYNASDNWNILVQASDGANISVGNVSKNTTIQLIGLFICNSTINVTSINYSILDQTTLLPVNATLTAVYTITDPAGIPSFSFVAYNSSVAVCIYPPYMSFTATVVETVNATGYQTNSISRPSQVYSNNTTQNTKLLLVSSTTGLSNTITVLLTTGGAGAVGYQVLNYLYYPATNTYLLSTSSITDNGGNTVQFLEPAPALYRLVILNPSNIIVWNQSAITYCTSGAPCTYTVVLENTNVDYAATLGSAFSHGALCSFSNTTNILSCNYTSLSASIPAVTLNLTITNSSGSVVNTSGAAYTTSPSFVSIGVPNITGQYEYTFYGYFAGTTQGAQIEFRVLLENGYITIGTPTANPSSIFGLVGWFLASLFSVGIALLFARIPAVMVMAGGGVFLLCSVIGLITLSATSFGLILILTVVLAFVVK